MPPPPRLPLLLLQPPLYECWTLSAVYHLGFELDWEIFRIAPLLLGILVLIGTLLVEEEEKLLIKKMGMVNSTQ